MVRPDLTAGLTRPMDHGTAAPVSRSWHFCRRGMKWACILGPTTFGAVPLATWMFLPGFWAVGAGLFALAVVLCMAPKSISGKKRG